MTLVQIRERICQILKWDEDDVCSFSLPVLQAFIKGKDENFDYILQYIINSNRRNQNDR